MFLTLSLLSPDSMIRLVNGSDGCSGRVEVFLHGVWGSVCDDGWGVEEAGVVCRMLGCGPALRALSQAHHGPASPNTPIWLDEVRCDGHETTLAGFYIFLSLFFFCYSFRAINGINVCPSTCEV